MSAQPPYRDATPPDPEPPDHEHLAIAEMAKRVRRVRGGVVVASFLLGIVGSALVYMAFDDYYASHNRMMPVKMAIISSFVIALVPALVLGPRLANLIVRMLRPGWLDASAQRHGLDRAQLDEMTASF